MVLVASGKQGRTVDGKDRCVGAAGAMTPEVLLEICNERKMWSLPHLNVQLYLNYKGFNNIGGLENYSAVRTLHLGNNNIARIEGLDRMLDLRSLHLEANRISCIDNLQNNLELRSLNLERNNIRSIAGLSHLRKLEQINLAYNSLSHLEELAELRELAKLSNIDVSHNLLDEVEGVVDFWSGFSASLRLLRYQGNPGVRFVEHYRKRLINALPMLSYLDERPAFPIERRSCKAWAEGGMEAMHQAKKDFVREQNAKLIMLDPERGEVLSRMRKVALARIDREAREREEKEEKHRTDNVDELKAPCATRVQDGDEEALEGYTKTWQTKLTLYGADGVRTSVVNEDKAALTSPVGGTESSSREQAASEMRGSLSSSLVPDRTLPDSSLMRTFAPPQRCTAADSHRMEAPSKAGTASNEGAPTARLQPKPLDASDFRVTRASRTEEGDEQWERQFAVLGADAWGSGSGSGGTAKLPEARCAGPALIQGKTAQREGAAGSEKGIVPLIWERSRQHNEAEERSCFEQSMRQESSAGVPGCQDELSALD